MCLQWRTIIIAIHAHIWEVHILRGQPVLPLLHSALCTNLHRSRCGSSVRIPRYWWFDSNASWVGGASPGWLGGGILGFGKDSLSEKWLEGTCEQYV